jgi:hypothetical protein
MVLGSAPLVAVAALRWSGPPPRELPFVLALAYNVILRNALAWFL